METSRIEADFHGLRVQVEFDELGSLHQPGGYVSLEDAQWVDPREFFDWDVEANNGDIVFDAWDQGIRPAPGDRVPGAIQDSILVLLDRMEWEPIWELIEENRYAGADREADSLRKSQRPCAAPPSAPPIEPVNFVTNMIREAMASRGLPR